VWIGEGGEGAGYIVSLGLILAYYPVFLSHLVRWIDGVGRLEKEKEAYKPGVVGSTSRLPPISLRWVIYLRGVACYIGRYICSEVCYRVIASTLGGNDALLGTGPVQIRRHNIKKVDL
jgi:hypothetical protein